MHVKLFDIVEDESLSTEDIKTQLNIIYDKVSGSVKDQSINIPSFIDRFFTNSSNLFKSYSEQYIALTKNEDFQITNVSNRQAKIVLNLDNIDFKQKANLLFPVPYGFKYNLTEYGIFILDFHDKIYNNFNAIYNDVNFELSKAISNLNERTHNRPKDININDKMITEFKKGITVFYDKRNSRKDRIPLIDALPNKNSILGLFDMINKLNAKYNRDDIYNVNDKILNLSEKIDILLDKIKTESDYDASDEFIKGLSKSTLMLANHAEIISIIYFHYIQFNRMCENIMETFES